jgi:hypothetical protein
VHTLIYVLMCLLPQVAATLGTCKLLPPDLECVYVTYSNPVNVEHEWWYWNYRMAVRGVQPIGCMWPSELTVNYICPMASFHQLRTEYVHEILQWILLSSEVWSRVVSTMSDGVRLKLSNECFQCSRLVSVFQRCRLQISSPSWHWYRSQWAHRLRHELWDRGFESHRRCGCLCV